MTTYPKFSATSTAAILALASLQVEHGTDLSTAVERAMHAWWHRILDVGNDSYEPFEILALAHAVVDASVRDREAAPEPPR